MAKFTTNPKIELKITLSLTEDEARALEALAGYGVDPFLKVFYAKMGRHYLEPHEAGLRSLFYAARGLSAYFDRKDKAERTFYGLDEKEKTK